MATAAAPHVSELPAVQVHERLQNALRDLQDAERNAVLWFAEIRSRKLYRELGFSSIHQYAQEALGFSRGRTFQFVRLAERFEELPELRRSVAEGSVSWTKARVVAGVATPATESEWVQDAKTRSRWEVERKAEAARARGRAARRKNPAQGSMLHDGPGKNGGAAAGSPGDTRVGGDAPTGDAPVGDAPAGDAPVGDATVDDATVGAARAATASETPIPEVPVDVLLHMRPEQYARFEALLAAARERGEQGDRVDLVLGALEALVAAPDSQPQPDDNIGVTRVTGGGPRSPYQVHVMLCPECGKGEAPTTRGPLPMGLADLAAMACDANVESGGKNRAVIPPRLRRAVLARDRYTCRGKGCGRTRFLNVHHIVQREHGGKNDPENLITLCGGCHRTLHGVADPMQWSPGEGARVQ